MKNKDNLIIDSEIKYKEIKIKEIESDGTLCKSCLHKRGCTIKKACGSLNCNQRCNGCKAITKCRKYEKFYCNKLFRFPFVCNGCPKRRTCTLSKQIYEAVYAFKEYKENLRMGSEIFNTLKSVLKERNLLCGVGDEGGFAPDLQSNEEGFKVIIEAIKKAGYIPGKDIYIAMDVASSEFYDKKTKKYNLKSIFYSHNAKKRD